MGPITNTTPLLVHTIRVLLFCPVTAALCPFSRPALVPCLCLRPPNPVLRVSHQMQDPNHLSYLPHALRPPVQLELYYLANNLLMFRHTLAVRHLPAALLTCNLRGLRAHWLEARALYLVTVYNYWFFTHSCLNLGEEPKLYVPQFPSK